MNTYPFGISLDWRLLSFMFCFCFFVLFCFFYLHLPKIMFISSTFCRLFHSLVKGWKVKTSLQYSRLTNIFLNFMESLQILPTKPTSLLLSCQEKNNLKNKKSCWICWAFFFLVRHEILKNKLDPLSCKCVNNVIPVVNFCKGY